MRVSYLKKPFNRDYDERYSREIFRISDRRVEQGLPIYYLEDLKGGKLKGGFYSFEIVPADYDSSKTFDIDKVIRTRVKGGKSQSLVRFLGWPPEFDEWIDTDKIADKRAPKFKKN